MTHSDIACPFSYKLDRLLKYKIYFESNGQPSFVLKESRNDQPPTCTKELHARDQWKVNIFGFMLTHSLDLIAESLLKWFTYSP